MVIRIGNGPYFDFSIYNDPPVRHGFLFHDLAVYFVLLIIRAPVVVYLVFVARVFVVSRAGLDLRFAIQGLFEIIELEEWVF